MRYRLEPSKREVKQGGAGNQLDPETSDDKTSGECMAQINMNAHDSLDRK